MMSRYEEELRLIEESCGNGEVDFVNKLETEEGKIGKELNDI